jgi:uncharacterized protein with von Willebrand factor type A (vWA) domain
MKSKFILGAALFLTTLLAGCGQSSNDGYSALQQTIADQNKAMLQQQQLMMSQQQQRIADEDARIDGLMQELMQDEADIKKLEAELGTGQPATAATVDVANTEEVIKNKMVKSLAGFNARLSASIGYESYADSLGDLNADLTTSMLQIKDQNFVDSVNKILSVYNTAGDFWEKFVRDNVDDIVVTSTERYRYAAIGVNFADNYHARPTDVRKFWTDASTEIDTLLETNKQDLGIAVTITKK